MYAPIVLFVYNRSDHAEKTLAALAENTIADKSDLFIYSDGAKNKEGQQKVDEVRELIGKPIWKEKFKSVTVKASDVNKGLANSIISGVSEIMARYGQAIVIEDDCVTLPLFLEFMNNGLEYYKDDISVGTISGFTFLKEFPKDYNHDIFAVRRFSSSVWASWKDRWDKADWNVSDYKKFCTDFKQRREFNRYGQDLSNMLDSQMIGNRNSWAIRFDYMLYKNNMHSIYSCKPMAKNIGFDEGTHVNTKSNAGSLFSVELDDNINLPKFESIDEDPRIVECYAAHFKKNILKRAILYFKNVIMNLYKIKKY